MKFQNIYKAACAAVVNVEQEYGKESDMYRKAVGGLNDIIAMRCTQCAGFGWNNPSFGGHTEYTKGREDTETCGGCHGSGFGIDD